MAERDIFPKGKINMYMCICIYVYVYMHLNVYLFVHFYSSLTPPSLPCILTLILTLIAITLTPLILIPVISLYSEELFMDYGNTYNREGYDEEAAGRENERNKVLAEEEERKLLQNTYVLCIYVHVCMYVLFLCT
jgi:hypothetical protein